MLQKKTPRPQEQTGSRRERSVCCDQPKQVHVRAPTCTSVVKNHVCSARSRKVLRTVVTRVCSLVRRSVCPPSAPVRPPQASQRRLRGQTKPAPERASGPTQPGRDTKRTEVQKRRHGGFEKNRPKHFHLHHPQPKWTATVRLTATKTLQERVFWWRLELAWTSRLTGAEEVTGGAGRIERPRCGTRAHVCANRVRARGRGSFGASASWAVRKDRVVADFGVTAEGERGSMQQQ
ncbi:uncharacterized protein LOC128092667 [Culex pipiens pallens]|uniref:uncharacterized protein LOC128092667 n=1 Tax=Culex pipiens pallens TaxID=42434 RepID=UPI0022AA47A4|nr:uncharacterized protein LOC128092667 [Culex pipiens pallens]